ncbi:hypothetical protein ACIRRH_39655 [Kitasatospora sp. NPDC101235]|uniref:hypothetical protein n=1 Tax=Kitasatospora sp. NPDC101235 TaxID=3364101 RepID=UPI003827AE65
MAAADTATPQPTADRIEIGMLFKGYDKAVADANGYTVKTSPQGFEYSVKKNATEAEDAAAQQLAAARWGIKPAAKPGHDVADDYSDYYNPQCGTAWLSGNAVGNLSVDLSTGFTLNPDQRAIFYYWEVTLSDSGGSSRQTWGRSACWRARPGRVTGTSRACRRATAMPGWRAPATPPSPTGRAAPRPRAR